MEQICPKNHHLSFFYPLENDFWYNKVDFSIKKNIHTCMNFSGLRL